jgi:hypothetical protein
MRRLYPIAIAFTVAIILTACSTSTRDKTLSKGGEVVGRTVGKFAQGVSGGVEQAFNVNIELSDQLKQKGVKLGKVILSNDTLGTDNMLSVYIIFDKDFKEPITLKAFDNRGLEMGRSKQEIIATKDDARFYDFKFDKRTNIDTDSKIVME